MDIVFVRLISGEELVGIKEHLTAGGLDLGKPLVVMVQPPRAPNQAPSIGFVPFVPYCDFEKDVLPLNRNHIVFMGKPVPPLEDAYRKARNLPAKIVTEKDHPGLILP